MIAFSIYNQRLLITKLNLIVAESIDYLTAEIECSDDWGGCEIWSHWKQGEKVYDIAIEEGKITADKHLNLSEGIWEVYFHGTKDEMRITTNSVFIRVGACGMLNGDPFDSVPLSAVEQLEQKIDNFDLGDKKILVSKPQELSEEEQTVVHENIGLYYDKITSRTLIVDHAEMACVDGKYTFPELLSDYVQADYIVTIDGTEYMATASGFGSSYVALTIGNHDFSMMKVGNSYTIDFSDKKDHTLSVVRIEHELERIDNRFLRGENTNNIIYDDSSFCRGSYNTIAGSYDFILGSYNTCEKHQSMIKGSYCTTEAMYTNALGLAINLGSDYQTAVGTWNDNEDDSLFEVGNGVADKPSNAFRVTKDGKAIAQTALQIGDITITAEQLKKLIDLIGG